MLVIIILIVVIGLVLYIKSKWAKQSTSQKRKNMDKMDTKEFRDFDSSDD